MSPETVEHLGRVEEVMRKAKLILARYSYPDDARTVTVMGTVTQIIEHHEAMLLLIRNDKIGSSFALIRSIVEGVYRGMWMNFCATECRNTGIRAGRQVASEHDRNGAGNRYEVSSAEIFRRLAC